MFVVTLRNGSGEVYIDAKHFKATDMYISFHNDHLQIGMGFVHFNNSEWEKVCYKDSTYPVLNDRDEER